MRTNSLLLVKRKKPVAGSDAVVPAVVHANHLTFLPDPATPRFFLWGAAPADPVSPVPAVLSLLTRGIPARATIIDESLAAREHEGTAVPLLDALPLLAAVTSEEAERAPASVVAWSYAAKLVLELAGRERVVPQLQGRQDGRTEARWSTALSLPEDADRVKTLGQAFPPAAHAVPVEAGAPAVRGRGRARPATRVAVWAPEALLRAFLDMSADTILRAAAMPGATRHGGGPRQKREAAPPPWEKRFVAALTSKDAAFETAGFRDRGLLGELTNWGRPALGTEPGAARACLRLDLPVNKTGAASPRVRGAASSFRLRYFLQAPDDPSLLLPAGEIWNTREESLRHLGRVFEGPQEHLLRSLAVAARVFPPVERSLREVRPAEVALDAGEAWAFLTEAAPALGEAGFGIILPAEFTRSGQRRLRLRMRISGGATAAGVAGAARGLGLEGLLAFRWEATLGSEALSSADLAALARLKAPLVRWRGQWVAADPAALKEARRFLLQGEGRVPVAEALSAALAGSGQSTSDAIPVDVVADGDFAGVLDRLRAGAAATAVPAPRGLHGTLRPYQERGVGWLWSLASLGLGACLADDMGLGKTIQVLAFLLARRQAALGDTRPSLVVCPTSVVGNWERELARFAPSLPVVRHYGTERARSPEAFADSQAGAVVLTSYGLLRRDAQALSAVDWAVAVLDEAQNIKNAASHSARAARALHASHRFALTGTPVENRLAELWSILEFAMPGILGPLATFHRQFAVPIERYRDEEAAERLRRIVHPFILRRLKSDPAVIRDLPPKNEMNIVCSLTREQATLYQAAVDEAMRTIRESEGIERRGRVLALITALKQICNHPAQYLGESTPLGGRSGKLARLGEMLEEVLAAGDRALVFTQFREMGDRLVAYLGDTLATEVLFLHGGVPRAARDRMVHRFQEDERGPRVFVLSLRAGGTGLNLTGASRVFHFDRWWNPAVEDQATDRAYRIGQKRAVQVYKLLTAGTVEEKVDRMLEDKRDLASRIVGAGEQWITELDDAALRELFTLSADAVVAADDGNEKSARAPRRAHSLSLGREPEPRRRGRPRLMARTPS